MDKWNDGIQINPVPEFTEKYAKNEPQKYAVKLFILNAKYFPEDLAEFFSE